MSGTGVFHLLALATALSIGYGVAMSLEPNPTDGPRELETTTIFPGENPGVDVTTAGDSSNRFRIAVISDSDTKSQTFKTKKGRERWLAYLKTGYVSFPNGNSSSTEPQVISSFSSFSRGNEFSTLNVFNNELVSCDDQSGIVYRLIDIKDKDGKPRRKQVPWVILADGDGTLSEGFRCEWATVKDNQLWIGGHGNSAENSFVKKVTSSGAVTHHDWHDVYEKIAEKLNSDSAVANESHYLKHEAVGWSESHRKWVFIPSQSMKQSDGDEDTMPAGNSIVIVDETLESFQVRSLLNETEPSLGISSFKWLPHAENQDKMIAIKTMADGDIHATYLMGLDMSGRVIFPEMKIDDIKYEGLEFI